MLCNFFNEITQPFVNLEDFQNYISQQHQKTIKQNFSIFNTNFNIFNHVKMTWSTPKRQFTHKLELFACWIAHGTITMPCYILLDPLLTEKENIVVQGCWISLPLLTLICMPMFIEIYGAELKGHFSQKVNVAIQFLFYLESSMLGILKVK